MNLYVLNITVPAKNKKYYERVSLNLFPMVFKIDEEIGEAFKRQDVIDCIKTVVKSRKLFDAAEIYIRDLTNINNIEEQTIKLEKLVPVELMNFTVEE